MSHYTRATRYRLKRSPEEKQGDAVVAWAKKKIAPELQQAFDEAWPIMVDKDDTKSRPRG